MDDPLVKAAQAEIAGIRRRLAELELVATAAATTPKAGATMHDSIANHYAAAPPPDRERARLQSLADRFTPNAQFEEALTTRARMGADAYDAEMRRVGAGQGMELALYSRSRDAAIALHAIDAPTTDTKGTDPK